MNSAPAGSHPWSRSRWFISILSVFVVQAGLLFAFHSRTPIVPPAPSPVPALGFSTGAEEILAVNDPTLFFLPHRQGFSGEAWLRTPRLEFQPVDWSERPRLLAWTGRPPAEDFGNSIRSNVLVAFEPFAIPEPEPEPDYSGVEPISRASTFRIEGALKDRLLRTPFTLPAWTNSDLLKDSVVQVKVDARGDTLSAVSLAPSGRTDADQLARELARSARFDPVQPVGPGRRESAAPEFTTGTIIFEWQTLPVPSTNAPGGP